MGYYLYEGHALYLLSTFYIFSSLLVPNFTRRSFGRSVVCVCVCVCVYVRVDGYRTQGMYVPPSPTVCVRSLLCVMRI